MLKVAIGFDPRETVAASVAAHSIIRRARQPVAISYIALSQLGSVLTRPRDRLQSNDFSFSRFLVPYLYDYRPDPVLFVDCDVLCLAPIDELFDLYDPAYAVQVVKHDYVPVDRETKYLDAPQRSYRRKNWSSVMLFNPPACLDLTPEAVNKAPGLFLHQFCWLDDDKLIGALPKGWNYLVGEHNQCPIDEVKLVHYTRGGPWFNEYDGCEFANAWKLERGNMLHSDQRGAA